MSDKIEHVRRRIGDSVKANTELFTSDGRKKLLSMAYKNLFDVKITINTTLLPSDEYAVSQEAGKVILNTIPEQDAEIIVEYKYAGFSDDYIKGLIESYGADGAVVEAIGTLLADSARFYDYTQGQTVDRRSQIFDHLKDLHQMAKEEVNAKTNSGFSIGNRVHSTAQVYGGFDLTRDDSFCSPVAGRSSNNG